MGFRLVPKSTTLDDLERRIQGLSKVFKHPLLSQERLKLQTSNLAGTFAGSIRNQKPIKNWPITCRAGRKILLTHSLTHWSLKQSQIQYHHQKMQDMD